MRRAEVRVGDTLTRPVASRRARPPRAPASGAFASLLAGCRSLFPPTLVDDAGWRRLLDRAKLLPASVADAQFGFEFHLAEAGAEADLCVVALPGSELSRHYVREGARAAPGSAAAALGAGLREQTANPASYLADSVDAVVLEYDLAGLAPRRPPPPPGIFFVPRKGAPASRRGFTEHRDPARLPRGARRHRRLARRRKAASERRAHRRGAAGTLFRVPGRRPPGALAAGGPDGRRRAREERGPRPAGAAGMARPDGRGGGRPRRRGRRRRPRRREPGRDRAGAGRAPRPGTVPPPALVRRRSRGMASLHRPDRRKGLVPAPPRRTGCGAGRAPTGCSAAERCTTSGRASTTSKVVIRKGARTVAKAYAGMDVIPYGSKLRPPAVAA